MRTADELIADAHDQTGLTDLGPATYREGLDILVGSLAAEARLSEIGQAALDAQITGNLANRLRVVDWTARHPELAHQHIERPVFVLGMPRTGTTLLSYLLDQDPAHRSLKRWEALASVPPPEPAGAAHDPRIEDARDAEEMLDALNPGFKAIHYEAPDGPTECVAIFSQEFKSLLWETVANVDGYGQWLRTCDLTSAYAYHQLELRLLQSRAPGRWYLKSPAHCFALDELVARYPDARFVMTHRDPIRVAASVCSLVNSLSGTFSDADHRPYIAAHWPEVVADGIERVMAYRDRNGDGAFLDLQYHELVADPMAAMRSVYAHVGEDLHPEVEARITAYVAANAQGTHGTHRYALEDLGLDRDALEDRFAGYRDRFAIPVEPSP